MNTTLPQIGIVTISDRASSNIYTDISGPTIKDTLNNFLSSSWISHYELIPDNQATIETTLIKLADDIKCCMILTTGGTGPSIRDVTPEATMQVCSKILYGFGEKMRVDSMKYTPTAILSRQIAGIRQKCLIINLPGHPNSIKVCLESIFPVIPYCIELIGGPILITNENIITSFRPHRQ